MEKYKYKFIKWQKVYDVGYHWYTKWIQLPSALEWKIIGLSNELLWKYNRDEASYLVKIANWDNNDKVEDIIYLEQNLYDYYWTISKFDELVKDKQITLKKDHKEIKEALRRLDNLKFTY